MICNLAQNVLYVVIGTVDISIPFPQRDANMYDLVKFKLTYSNRIINLLISSDIM